MFTNLKKEQLLQSNFPFGDYTLDYTLDSLERMGARMIEFYAAEPHFNLFDIDTAQMKVLKRKLSDHGLGVVEINPENCKYPVNLASLHSETRRRAFSYYEKAILTAGTIGADKVCIFPGFALKNQSVDTAWALAVDTIGRLADIARCEGVTITFEATTPNLTVITDHKKVMKMINDCGCQNIGVTIDMMCLMQTNETVQDVFDLCSAERIVNVHFTDGALMPNGSWEHRIPGEGTVDLDSELKMFDQNHYTGYFGSEVTWSVDPATISKGPEAICQKIQDWWDARFTGA